MRGMVFTFIMWHCYYYTPCMHNCKFNHFLYMYQAIKPIHFSKIACAFSLIVVQLSRPVKPHTCTTLWYVQVYCVLECVRICHYDDVQVHVSNNASVCTSVSQHERMHVHALCVSCKEITIRNHCNRSRVDKAGIR